MSEERPVFVARDQDLDTLQGHWRQALDGRSQMVRLQAPFGGGRRALSSEFLRQVQTHQEDAVIWRVSCLDQENGLQWLVRMYGSLVATLTGDVLRRGRIEMLLNAQLPSQPARVQGWYQQFVAALKESRTDKEKGQVQLRIPQDNPLIGLVEIVVAIARKVPVVLELQNPYVVNSLTLSLFVDALHAEAVSSNARLMTLLFDEPEGEVTKALFPMPLLDLYQRREAEIGVLPIAPWGAEETKRYLESKELDTTNAARIAEIASGRPGFIAELAEILEEKGTLSGDLSEVSLASLVPLDVDESELDVPDSPPAEGERKPVTAADAGQVAYFAALLGQAFPSALVADMGGFDRESVDDLIDAMGTLFEEVQFSQELGTWIYRFARGSWREGILEQNATDEGRDLARRVGLFMERFLVPRGYGFIVKTCRIYAENGAPDRAAVMRSLALTNDNPDVWGLAYDFTGYFDEVPWPDPLLRTVYMNLLDKLVSGGNLNAADQIHAKVSEWAGSRDDRELTAWLLYAGSRLDSRRQDLFRARDRAKDALKLYEGMNNSMRVAEIYNHLATLELQDGNPNAALEFVDKAVDIGQVEQEDGKKLHVPGVLASALHIRGLVARRTGKLPDAIEQFRQANEIAGQAGIAQLALDSGLAFGEALLASGQVEKARDALERVVQIAQAIRNPVRERNACELLAQAEAALRNFDKALPLAQRTLELTQALKFEQALPIDLYNLGFFHFVTDKPSEALTYFKQAEPRIGALGKHPVVKEFWYFKGLSHMRVGELDEGKTALRASLKPIQEAQDWRKMCSALENLSIIEERQGKVDVARKLVADAVGFAKKANLKDEKKALRKRLEALGGTV